MSTGSAGTSSAATDAGGLKIAVSQCLSAVNQCASVKKKIQKVDNLFGTTANKKRFGGATYGSVDGVLLLRTQELGLLL